MPTPLSPLEISGAKHFCSAPAGPLGDETPDDEVRVPELPDTAALPSDPLRVGVRPVLNGFACTFVGVPGALEDCVARGALAKGCTAGPGIAGAGDAATGRGRARRSSSLPSISSLP